MEYLEQLTREWYEYQGYFVRRDLWVGLQSDGSYECDLDVVAYHPLRRHVVQIEPSLDLLPPQEKEQHFALKFSAGRRYLHRLFGPSSGLHIEQIALVLSSGQLHRQTIAGGRVVLLRDFIGQMLRQLAGVDPAAALVPDQWPLLRTLQFAAAYQSEVRAELATAAGAAGHIAAS